MTAPKITLWGYWRSSATWRVRTALGLKSLAYEYVPVHLVQDGGQQYADAYRAQNPLQQVPVVEIDGQRLAQSLAICEYLDVVQPTPRLFPGDPYLRARAWQLAEIVNSGIQPLQNLSVLKRLDASGLSSKEWAAHWIGKGLGALEAETKETAGRYSIGDAVSVADVCLVPQLYNARRFGVALEAFPTLVRIEGECQNIAAFAAAHPDRQPDAQPS
jgi:maleylpyruvate isomerase